MGELIVVQFHQGNDGFFDRCQLYQSRLLILVEISESDNLEALSDEDLLQLRLLDGGGDVRQVQGGRRRADVQVVFGTRFLEAVEVRGGVVFEHTRVRYTDLGQLLH